MIRSDSCNPLGQPSLTDLLVRFLATRSDAAAAAVEPASGEVEPHEVAAGFRVDPRAAWTDAVASLHPAAIPADWSSFVNLPAPAFAVALAVGNFPQRVKDLHPLLARFDTRQLRPTTESSPVPGCTTLRSWVEREAKKGTAESLLLAAGLARVLGDFDRAERLLTEAENPCAGSMRATWENERAALLWHRGRCDEALAAWSAMADSPTVWFNRGMALLFTGKSKEARTALTNATQGIPEASGWNSLARLYLAVAEIQG